MNVFICLATLFTLSQGYIIKTGGGTGRGVLTQEDLKRIPHKNPATGMLGAYNYNPDTGRYTSTRLMTIRQPYRADDGSDEYSGYGWDMRLIPGYRRNQHLWAGEHQKNYVPIVDRDGWVRRYWRDQDALHAILNSPESQKPGAFGGYVIGSRTKPLSLNDMISKIVTEAANNPLPLAPNQPEPTPRRLAPNQPQGTARRYAQPPRQQTDDEIWGRGIDDRTAIARQAARIQQRRQD